MDLVKTLQCLIKDFNADDDIPYLSFPCTAFQCLSLDQRIRTRIYIAHTSCGTLVYSTLRYIFIMSILQRTSKVEASLS